MMSDNIGSVSIEKLMKILDKSKNKEELLKLLKSKKENGRDTESIGNIKTNEYISNQELISQKEELEVSQKYNHSNTSPPEHLHHEFSSSKSNIIDNKIATKKDNDNKKPNLLVGYDDDSDDSNEDEDGEDEKVIKKANISKRNEQFISSNLPSSSALPMNFFDSSVEQKRTEKSKESNEKISQHSTHNEKIGGEIKENKETQSTRTNMQSIEDTDNDLEDLATLEVLLAELEEEETVEGNEELLIDTKMQREDLEDLYYGARLAKLIGSLQQKKSQRKKEQNLQNEIEDVNLITSIAESNLPRINTAFSDEIERERDTLQKPKKRKLETETQKGIEEDEIQDYHNREGNDIVTSTVEEIMHKRKKSKNSEKIKGKKNKQKNSKEKLLNFDDESEWRGSGAIF